MTDVSPTVYPWPMTDRSKQDGQRRPIEVREITPAEIDRVMERALEREKPRFRITPSQRRAARKRA
jgi:hypothetical protein